MTLRRTVLLLLGASLLALLVACSDGGGGETGAPSDDNGAVDGPRATLQSAAETAAAAGTKAAQVNTPRPSDTPLPLSALSGDFEARFTYQGERPGSELRDTLEMPDNIDIVIGEGTITISGRAPFVSMTGSLSADGAISATGTGTNEEWGELTGTFEGTLADQRLTGTYTLTGGLPGGSVAFELTGQFDG